MVHRRSVFLNEGWNVWIFLVVCCPLCGQVIEFRLSLHIKFHNECSGNNEVTGMAITALGYLGIRSDRQDDWSDFAQKLLGMQKIDQGGKTMAFRMDDHAQRFVISDEPGETLAFMGWEVETKEDLEHFATRLDAAGYPVEWGGLELADRRLVEALIYTKDLAGNRIELIFNPMLASAPFTPAQIGRASCREGV